MASRTFLLSAEQIFEITTKERFSPLLTLSTFGPNVPFPSPRPTSQCSFRIAAIRRWRSTFTGWKPAVQTKRTFAALAPVGSI